MDQYTTLPKTYDIIMQHDTNIAHVSVKNAPSMYAHICKAKHHHTKYGKRLFLSSSDRIPATFRATRTITNKPSVNIVLSDTRTITSKPSDNLVLSDSVWTVILIAEQITEKRPRDNNFPYPYTRNDSRKSNVSRYSPANFLGEEKYCSFYTGHVITSLAPSKFSHSAATNSWQFFSNQAAISPEVLRFVAYGKPINTSAISKRPKRSDPTKASPGTDKSQEGIYQELQVSAHSPVRGSELLKTIPAGLPYLTHTTTATFFHSAKTTHWSLHANSHVTLTAGSKLSRSRSVVVHNNEIVRPSLHFISTTTGIWPSHKKSNHEKEKVRSGNSLIFTYLPEKLNIEAISRYTLPGLKLEFDHHMQSPRGTASEEEALLSDGEDSKITSRLEKLKFRTNNVTASAPNLSDTEFLGIQTLTPKRKSSSPLADQSSKKRFLNPMAPPKFADVVQKKLFVVDIVLDSNEETGLSSDQGNMIQEVLTKALFASEKLNTLDFEYCGYERGVFRTISRNEETKKWIIEVTPTLNFDNWPEANIKAVEAGTPPRMVRASVILSFPTPDVGEVFEIIDARNPSINTKFWRLYRKNKVEKGKQLWSIGVDEDSAKEIKNMDYSVQYGLNRLKVSIHEAKRANKTTR